MPENLGEYLKRAVDKYGDQLSMHIRRGYRVEKYTYREVWDMALRFRTLLLERGIKKGQKVLLWSPNMPEWVIALFGCYISGVVVVPVSVHASSETVKEYVSQTNAKLLFKSVFIHENSPEGPEELLLEKLMDEIRGLEPTGPEDVDGDDLAEIMYTSGTTGDPAGVMLSHRNILVGLRGLKTLIPPSKEYRLLSILPLSHALEQLLGLLTVFDFGASVYYLARVNPVTIVKSLRKYRITHLIVVPQLLKVMWDAIEYRVDNEGKSGVFRSALSVAPYLPISVRRFLFRKVHRNLGGELKMFGCAGAPLDTFIGENWEKIGTVVIEGYGTTETSAGVTANTISDRKLGSIGKFLADIDSRFADDGEILAKGPSVTAGYFKNPEKTRESFTKDGYFRTGDIGYEEDDGFVYLSGRKKFKIVTPSGEKVYPEDVEKKLNEHPSVRESCVVGIDKGSGEIVYAALVLKGDVPAEDVVAEVNEVLESHQKILEFGVWPEDDFPRTRTLKKDRRRVREWAVSVFDGKEGDLTDEADTTAERDQVKEIIALVCDIQERKISEDSKLVLDLDLDSLKRVALVALIEEEFGVDVMEEDVGEKTTVSELREIISKAEKVSFELSHVTWPLSPLVVRMREIVRRIVLFPLFRIIIPPVEIKGKKHLKNMEAPSILIFNHVGHNEPMMIIRSLPSHVRMKQTAIADPRSFRNSVRAFFMYFFAAAFPVDKFGGPVRHTLDLVADLLDEGWLLMISPEGERSADGKLQDFKKGASVMAVETGVPVYPVKVKGYRDVYPAQGKDFDVPSGKGKITLVFGAPVRFDKELSYTDATEKMRSILEEM